MQPTNYQQRTLGELLMDIPDRPINRKIEYTSGLLAGENMSEKLKQKIWDDKYVDFYDILYPDQEHG